MVNNYSLRSNNLYFYHYMKWSQALKDFQLYLKIERGLSLNSINNYALDVEKLINFLKENQIDTSPLSISKETVKDFVYTTSKKVTASTQSRIISGLRSFFGFLVFEGYRKDNPTDLLESPKTTRKLPDFLSEEEVDSLIAAIDLSKPEGERNRAILETLYGCGLRVSELTKLKLSDLYFDEGFIRVTGKGDKQRLVPVVKSTQKYIKIYLSEVRNHLEIQPGFEDTVFLNRRGKQLTRAMIFTVIRKLCEKAGIKRAVSPHTFRHSFATHLLKNGADLRSIQLMLGHESITTTEIYVHADRSHLSKIINAYHPRK